MRAQEMKRLMSMIERLTPAQREALVTSLGSRIANSEALDLVQARVGRTPTCPTCQADKVVRNGQADGLQRYKCRGCGVTFNALSRARRWRGCVTATSGCYRPNHWIRARACGVPRRAWTHTERRRFAGGIAS